MVEIKGKQFCENCFEESSTPFCSHCGYNPAVTANDPTMLQPGNVLLGKYIVGRIMGKGGFGVTYLAYDVTADRKVAIKEFFPYGVALRASGTTTVSVASMDNAEAFKLGAEKFYNEAKLVSKFNGNPNIVGVYEFFYENDTVYFVMEYLQGCTLKEYIQKNGPLTAGQALYVVQNVANALMAAHSSNVLHRDISPDNIIICDNGDVKLIDFGAARQVVAEHSQSFSVILKPGFAPLEQYQKKGNQGPWTDIYSLGATTYYSLTEDIPEDPMSRLDDDEEYSSNHYNINPELWGIISRATQLKIEDRYGDIFQLKSDLSAISIPTEPLVIPGDDSTKMPEFKTAMPFGMTQQAAPQTVSQPVGVGAPAPATVGSPNAVYGQPVPPNVVPKKRPSKGKIAAICCGVAAVVAAGIIIPIAVTKSKDKTPNSNTSQNLGTSTLSAAELEKKVEEADGIAKLISNDINDFVADIISTTGSEISLGSSSVIQISVYNTGEWRVSGIDNENQSEQLASRLGNDFPNIRGADILAVLDPYCSFVAYSTHDTLNIEMTEDWSDIHQMLVESSGKVPSAYEWDGKTAGVTPVRQLIVGTYPKLGLAKGGGGGSGTTTTKVTNQAYTTPNGKSITYTGDWSNNMPNGQGKGVYENGTVYEGEWKDGLRSGKGKNTWETENGTAVFEGEFKNDDGNGQCKRTNYDKNGIVTSIYEGEYKDGSMNGQGKSTYYDENGKVSESYVGEYKDSKRNGQGTYTYASGDVYEGEWKDGNPNGQGKYTWKESGNYYIGEFNENGRNGQGTLYDKSGKVLQSGTWADDKFVGAATEKVTNQRYSNGTYTGEWADGKPNGNGYMLWDSGDTYDGGWKDGQYHGKGKLTWPGGDVFEGEYIDGKKNGHGKYTWAGGDVFEGEYKDGNRNGLGRYTWATGAYREGEYKNDKLEGQVTYCDKNGKKTIETWKNGEKVS